MKRAGSINVTRSPVTVAASPLARIHVEGPESVEVSTKLGQVLSGLRNILSTSFVSFTSDEFCET